MKVTPSIILAGVVLCGWTALAETKTATRHKADSDEEATPSPKKKSATPKPKTAASEDDEDKPKPVTKKFSDGDAPAPASTPHRRTNKDSEDDEPKPKATPSRRKSDDDAPAATPHAKVKTDIDEKSDTVKKKESEGTPAPGATPGGKGAPPASIESTELARFNEQPPKVKQLIESALALSKLGLTYKYGSDDPASGGMDCSGSIAYMLRQQGFKDVPRDASGQYVWARKNGKFFAVISKKAGGFEFDDLQPGDLMFWSGTYSIDRDPPVTHTMIYLGEHKSRKQRVMWGSSDGRSYDGQSRFGVGVFDFKMPKAGGEGEGTTAVGNHPDFLGYARIPGLRDAAEEKTASESPSKSAENETKESEHKSAKAEPEPKATPAEPKRSPTRRKGTH